MKKELLILLFLPMIGFGQNCPTTGFPSYYNCSDIAQFVVDYPNCTNLPSTLRLPYDGGDLTNYPGLTQLDSISGSVVCDECEITSFAGLSALKYVGGSVRIDEPHDILTDLYGLTNLSHIGGSLTLLECGDLISTNGIANLNSINQVRIVECDNLVNIVGFDDIDSLAWGLYIEETSLTNLNGFNNLKFIGNLEISDNPMLNNLIGLSSVLTVDGYIEIDDNISLQSLLGLDSIIPNQISNLILKDNDSLSYCDLDNICEYIDQAYGPSTIYANNTNCNSILEVQNQCGTPTPSWDCGITGCYDPGTGIGQYTTLSACQSVCVSTVSNLCDSMTLFSTGGSPQTILMAEVLNINTIIASWITTAPDGTVLGIDSMSNSHQIFNNMNNGQPYDTINVCITYSDATGYSTCCVTWIWDANLWISNVSVTSIGEIGKSDKKILKVVDILGRESGKSKNQPLFYIYDDGTVEQRIVLE